MPQITQAQIDNRILAKERIDQGKYQQVTGIFRRGDHFCFNAVLIDTLINTGQIECSWTPAYGHARSENTIYSVSPFTPQTLQILKDAYGMTSAEYNAATVCNDNHRMSLPQIAQLFVDQKLLSEK